MRYSHCNMCNIQIYFSNIHMKYLQHTFEASETSSVYVCNTCLRRNMTRAVRRTHVVEVAAIANGGTSMRWTWLRQVDGGVMAQRRRPREVDGAVAAGGTSPRDAMEAANPSG
jgi:hypothetical protein